MAGTSEDPSEGLSLSVVEGKTQEYVHWNRNSTLKFLFLYKEYKNKVGTSQIKTLKQLWVVLSTLMKSKYGIDVAASHCENRWRVLERSFKKVIDNNKKTGRGRINFEYEKEMEEILGHKRNIIPQLLLSTEDVEESSKRELVQDVENVPPLQTRALENTTVTPQTETSSTVSAQEIPKSIHTPRGVKRTRLVGSKSDSMEKWRNEKLKCHNERLHLEKEKLLIEKEKVAARKRKNDLIQERNKLLQMYIEKNVKLPDGSL